ncbi:hypothetical protein BGZ75_005658 [Mortierella antarctica]|nr:hypothetical protein BGZ75_005658 [Mortierella antarctica]
MLEERLAGGAQGAAQRPQTFTAPTWARFAVEDNTENLDLTQLQNITTHARGKRRLLVFAGTDYGVVKMSETVAVTQAQIQTHINRYHQLYGKFAIFIPHTVVDSAIKCRSGV